jgi:ATP-binding cassette subfamily F protein uup
MSTIHLNEISKQFGEKLLFKDLSLSINDRARIGIIGPNGKGKSTFLKIIAGIEDIDSGEIHKPKSLVISYAEQLVPYKIHETINSILADKNSSNKNPLDINKLNSHLDRFGINDFDSPLSSFSGGQRKKIQLSFIFSEEPDFLLLDEPSNHLDMESIIQLEQILNSLSMSILMISHDRKLLESFSNEIIEINPIYPECYFHTEGN